MRTSYTKTFVIIFFKEVMGLLGGRTVAGTASRYAADAGLNPADADLQVIDLATLKVGDPLIDQAQKAGWIKLTRTTKEK